MTRRSLALAGVVSSGAAVLWASMTLTPGSHDFGQLPVGSSAHQQFQLTGTTPRSLRFVPKVDIQGPDAAEFAVDSTRANVAGSVLAPAPGGTPLNPSPLVLQSSCLGTYWSLNGSCDYRVSFSPTSVGKKTARLVVSENGITTTATLKGEGIFGCRAYLVSCNYADNYSGSITIKTVDSTTSGALARKVRYDTNVDITIVNGVASCSGVETDFEEEYMMAPSPTTSGPPPKPGAPAPPPPPPKAILRTRGTTKGIINGPGLFAVEFQQTGGTFGYQMKFDCPTASQTITSIDYLTNTTSTSQVAAEPAEWRHASLVADPRPATQVGMVDLVGKQLDVHAGSGANDEAGYSSMVWSLKRR